MTTTRLFLLLLVLAGCGGASPSTTATTTIVADDRPHDQGAVARFAREWPEAATRTFAIRWTSPGTSWLYDGTLALTRHGSRVEGMFHWRLLSVSAAMAVLQSRVGDTTVEQIQGAFDASLGELVLHTTFLGDPTLVGAASYRIRVDGPTLVGATAGAEDGVWDGVLEGVATD